ncbi:MAG: tetraacyldisaccharide 4'-kinase [Gammaproteobacteria bacterium]|nr:tetraacyldisaccharide 4'-kinase [Gammaproteobacteria bacterium]
MSLIKSLASKSWIIKAVEKRWYSAHKTLFAYILLPFSYFFLGIVKLRRNFYRRGWLKTYRAPCPVIVVGNIGIGGVGKTPLVVALYFFLKDRGWTPGIVSRGYKGKYQGIAWVASDSDPHQVGDEAVLLAARTGGPVVVARDRVRAAQALTQEVACNIILSDDGLQHYALERDIEIAVIDAARNLGNALCLPAGPLREPPSRLKEVDMVVINGGDESRCAFSLSAISLLNVANPNISKSVQTLHEKKVHAVAGIGSPERFFNYLKGLGAEVVEYSYPDHYQFQKSDFVLFNSEDTVIMTEKDAVKCRSFARKNVWFLPVEARLNVLFIKRFESCVQSLLKHKE